MCTFYVQIGKIGKTLKLSMSVAPQKSRTIQEMLSLLSIFLRYIFEVKILFRISCDFHRLISLLDKGTKVTLGLLI